MKKPSAFSLVELSIVITILAILAAGIMQGKSIVSQSRIRAAQTQTARSPVPSISNLALWLESTSERSFISSEASDGSAVSTWRDLNPQALAALNLLQSNNNNKPIYKRNVSNGLPMLKFNGSTSYFEIPYNPDLNPSHITVFTVVKSFSSADYAAIVSSRNEPSPRIGYTLYLTPGQNPSYEFWTGNGNNSWGTPPSSKVAINDTTILTLTNNSSTTALYVNGSRIGENPSVMVSNNTNNLRVGAGKNESSIPQYYYNGYIGELIIFGRALKNEERKSVEKYLSRKWGIAVS